MERTCDCGADLTADDAITGKPNDILSGHVVEYDSSDGEKRLLFTSDQRMPDQTPLTWRCAKCKRCLDVDVDLWEV
jgi:hypothetical protein